MVQAPTKGFDLCLAPALLEGGGGGGGIPRIYIGTDRMTPSDQRVCIPIQSTTLNGGAACWSSARSGLGEAVAGTYLPYTRLDKNPVAGCHLIHSRPPVYREPPTHPDYPFIGCHMHTAPLHPCSPALIKPPHRSTRVPH